eukprot:CAMPEP_0179248638 /NCGR_PEP_ID=MMETSP0797-20121207/20229_1 /TAXON_ID=47934 /ORGANISM="Dinophysis acuminata, Strain DAEP01" /LENGTH=516 /DNA_ID=CAMNT_0020956297 /DNA_START=91 /DNA_END=1640 /DNA_ORIENTATION=-
MEDLSAPFKAAWCSLPTIFGSNSTEECLHAAVGQNGTTPDRAGVWGVSGSENHGGNSEFDERVIRPLPATCGVQNMDGGVSLTEYNFHTSVQQDSTIHVRQAERPRAPRGGVAAHLEKNEMARLSGDSNQTKSASHNVCAENLRDLRAKEEALKFSGDHVAAEELHSCAQGIDQSAFGLSQIDDEMGKLARLSEQIAGNSEWGWRQQVALLQDELGKVLETIERAAGNHSGELRQLSVGISKRTKLISADKRWHSSCGTSASYASGALCSCSAGFGYLFCLSMQSARAIANVPCVGQCFAATSVTNGWFGSVATSTTLVPGASCILCMGSACCGASAAGLSCARSHYASRQQHQSQVHADAMAECRESAELNQEAWRGVSLLCKQARIGLMGPPHRGGPSQKQKAEMELVGDKFLMHPESVSTLIRSLERRGSTSTDYGTAALPTNTVQWQTSVSPSGDAVRSTTDLPETAAENRAHRVHKDKQPDIPHPANLARMVLIRCASERNNYTRSDNNCD